RDLCVRLMSRNLYHTELYDVFPGEGKVRKLQERAQEYLGVKPEVADYLVWSQEIENSAYKPSHDPIRILMKDGKVLNISKASDLSNIEALSKKVKKYAVTFPKELLNKG
ncbi:MAG TPA: phosphohydrolase, partial [Sphingobacteriaceae bacterium]|nr:phosphohydrolase [Sphingobacteriaceae bacterium]